MKCENLPLFKAILDLNVYLDSIVKNLDTYHKYSICLQVSTSLARRQCPSIFMNSSLDSAPFYYAVLLPKCIRGFNYKKAKYLKAYEAQRGKMGLAQIKQFLSVQASFVSHAKHANSYNLMNKVGNINETDPFDYTRI